VLVRAKLNENFPIYIPTLINIEKCQIHLLKLGFKRDFYTWRKSETWGFSDNSRLDSLKSSKPNSVAT
jgi:hypothetical protein